MSRFQQIAAMTAGVAACLAAGCATREVPPSVGASFAGIPLNGGRVQAISVKPQDAREIIFATQFGGLWKTTDGGAHWAHLRSLKVFSSADVQYGADGRTVIATLPADIRVANGGGIYVSRDGGETFARPASGAIPLDARTPARASAWAISRPPDEPQRWYVGTSYGVAISADNGASWDHVKVDSSVAAWDSKLQDAVNSIVALRGGAVLALLDHGIYRSDNRGVDWRRIKSGDFSFYNHWTGFNKLERTMNGVNVLAVENYSKLHFYESIEDRWTELALPGGGGRGPFVRVASPPASLILDGDGGTTGPGPGGVTPAGTPELIIVSQGTYAIATIVRSADQIRRLRPEDWAAFGRSAGVHDDLGDLGVATAARGGPGEPVMIGSDGGVFKPTGSAGLDEWTTGAPNGSGLNSWQITDLAGHSLRLSDRPNKTTVYMTTQDNGIWSSIDGGRNFVNWDCAEGFHVETDPFAETAQDVTVAYGSVGCNGASRMSDENLVNQRDVSDSLVGGGTASGFWQAFYLAPQRWMRGRAGGPGVELYVSTDNGLLWRKRYDVAANGAGVIQRSDIHLGPDGVSAYYPAFTGDSNPAAVGGMRIGLVRLSAPFGAGVTPAPALLALPDGGSLGLRATEFDWQAVFGVHPKDSRFIVAPDIVNGRVMRTTSGGDRWERDDRLTAQVSQGGRISLNGWGYAAQVTHFGFDPYNDDRILVGTQLAGVVCTRDRGATWRMVDGSEGITYATGFYFYEAGDVLVSTYGRGLWHIPANKAWCSGGRDWSDGARPSPGGADMTAGRTSTGGARLIISSSTPSAGVTVLGSDRLLTVRASGFSPSGAELVLSIDGEPLAVKAKILTDGNGESVVEVQVPEDLAPGAHLLELLEPGSARFARAMFVRVELDEHLGEPSALPAGAPSLQKIWRRRLEEEAAGRPNDQPNPNDPLRR